MRKLLSASGCIKTYWSFLTLIFAGVVPLIVVGKLLVGERRRTSRAPWVADLMGTELTVSSDKQLAGLFMQLWLGMSRNSSRDVKYNALLGVMWQRGHGLVSGRNSQHYRTDREKVDGTWQSGGRLLIFFLLFSFFFCCFCLWKNEQHDKRFNNRSRVSSLIFFRTGCL